MKYLKLKSALFLICGSAAADAIQVPLHFVEALAPRDSTSSVRFQKDFEKAIAVGKSQTATQLSRCGYEIITSNSFYDAGDPLQAAEKAKAAEAAGAWMIVGPRRSNHYLVLVKGVEKTPTVSLMASATEISALGKTHLTVSPLNSQLAGVAAKEAKARSKAGAKFISMVSSDCVTCVDFADHFETAAAKARLQRLDRIALQAELPELAEIRELVISKKPNFIVLPNYSKTSAHIMAGLADVFKGFYVGGDGWGDSNFGFVQNGPNLDQINGFTVRGFPPFDEGMKTISFRDKVAADDLPKSGPALAILQTMNSLAKLLCQSKPKSRSEFSTAIEKLGIRELSAPWGVSVYGLKGGNITFAKTVKVSAK